MDPLNMPVNDHAPGSDQWWKVRQDILEREAARRRATCQGHCPWRKNLLMCRCWMEARAWENSTRPTEHQYPTEAA